MKLLMKHFTVYWMKFHVFQKVSVVVSVTGIKILIIQPRHLHYCVQEKAKGKNQNITSYGKNAKCIFNNKSSCK